MIPTSDGSPVQLGRRNRGAAKFVDGANNNNNNNAATSNDSTGGGAPNQSSSSSSPRGLTTFSLPSPPSARHSAAATNQNSPSSFQQNAKRRVSLAQGLGAQLKFMTPAQQQALVDQESGGGGGKQGSAGSLASAKSQGSNPGTTAASSSAATGGATSSGGCAALEAGIRVGVSLRAREYIAVGFYEAAIAACIKENDMTSWSVALSLSGEPHKAADVLEAFIIAACLVTYQHRKRSSFASGAVLFDYKQVLASIISSPGAPATTDIMKSLPPPSDQDYHETILDLCQAVSWSELHLWYLVAVLLHPAYEAPQNPWLRHFFCLIAPPEVIDPDALGSRIRNVIKNSSNKKPQSNNNNKAKSNRGRNGDDDDDRPGMVSEITGSTRRLTRTDVENILISQASDTEVLVVNAIVSWVLGRYRSALRTATAALQVDPDDIQIRFIRCCCALQVGDRKLVGDDSTFLRQSESLFVATVGCALATYGIPQASAKSAVEQFRSSVQFAEELYTHALCEWGHALTLLQLGEFEAARDVAQNAVKTAPKRNLREWLSDVLVIASVALEDSAYLVRIQEGKIVGLVDGLTPKQELYLALVPCFGGGYAFDSVNKLLIDSDVGELLNPANVTNYADVRHMLPIHMTTARSLLSYGRVREAWKEVKSAVACAEEILGSAVYSMSDCAPHRVLFFGCTVGVAMLDRMIEDDPLAGEETQDAAILKKRKEDDIFGDEIIATCRVWARLIRDFHPLLVLGHAAVCQVSIASHDLDSIERVVVLANMFPSSILAQNCLSYALFSKHLIPEADAQALKTLQRFPHVPEVDAMANLIHKAATQSNVPVTYKYVYRGVLPFTYGPGDTSTTSLRQLFALFITFVNICMQVFTVLCNLLPSWLAYAVSEATVRRVQIHTVIPFYVSAGYLAYVLIATFAVPNMVSVLLTDLKFRQTRLNRFQFSSRAFGLLNIANVVLMYLQNDGMELTSGLYTVLLFGGLALLYFPYSTRCFFMRSVDEPSMELPFWLILFSADLLLYLVLAPLHVLNAAIEPLFFFLFTLLGFTPKPKPDYDSPYIVKRLREHQKALESDAPHRYSATSGSRFLYFETTKLLYAKTHSSMRTEFLGAMQDEDDDLRVFPLITLLDVVEAVPMPTPVPPAAGAAAYKAGGGGGGAAGPGRRKSLAVFKRVTSELGDGPTAHKDDAANDAAANDGSNKKDLIPIGGTMQPGITVVQSVTDFLRDSDDEDSDDDSSSLEPKNSFGARMMAALNEEFEKLNKFNAKAARNNQQALDDMDSNSSNHNAAGGAGSLNVGYGDARQTIGSAAGGARVTYRSAALGETGLYLEGGRNQTGGAVGMAPMFMMHGQGLENRRGQSPGPLNGPRAVSPSATTHPGGGTASSPNKSSAATAGSGGSGAAAGSPPQRLQRVKSIFGRPVMHDSDEDSVSSSDSDVEVTTTNTTTNKVPSGKPPLITAANSPNKTSSSSGNNNNNTVVSATARILQTARRRLSSFGVEDDDATTTTAGAAADTNASSPNRNGTGNAARRVSSEAQQLLIATSNANRRTSLFRGGGAPTTTTTASTNSMAAAAAAAAARHSQKTSSQQQPTGGDFFEDNLSDNDDTTLFQKDESDAFVISTHSQDKLHAGTLVGDGAAGGGAMKRRTSSSSNKKDLSPQNSDLMPVRRRSVQDPFVAFHTDSRGTPSPTLATPKQSGGNLMTTATVFASGVPNPLERPSSRPPPSSTTLPSLSAIPSLVASPQPSHLSDPPTTVTQTVVGRNTQRVSTVKRRNEDDDDLELSDDDDEEEGEKDLLGTPQSKPLPLPNSTTTNHNNNNNNAPAASPSPPRSFTIATRSASPPLAAQHHTTSSSHSPPRPQPQPQQQQQPPTAADLRTKRQSVVGPPPPPIAGPIGGGGATESYGAQLRRKQSVMVAGGFHTASPQSQQQQQQYSEDAYSSPGGMSPKSVDGGRPFDRRKSVKDLLSNASNTAHQLQTQSATRTNAVPAPGAMLQHRASISPGATDMNRRASSAPAHGNRTDHSSSDNEGDDPALKPVNGNVKVRRLAEELRQIRTTVSSQLTGGGHHGGSAGPDPNAAGYLRKTLESAKHKFVADLAKIAPRIIIDAFETKRVVTDLFVDLAKEGEVNRPGNIAVLSALLSTIVSTPAFDWTQLILGRGMLREALLEGFGQTFETLASYKPIRSSATPADAQQWLQTSMTANDRRCSSLLGVVRLSTRCSVFQEYGADFAEIWQNTLDRVLSLAQALPNEDRSDLPELLDAVIEHPFVEFNLDTRENSSDKQTVFSRACREGDHEVVQWLLLHRQLALSSPNRVQSDGTNALQQAVARNHLTVVRMLLRPPPQMSAKGTIQLNGGGPEVFAESLRHVVPGKGTALQIAKGLKRHEGIIEALEEAETALQQSGGGGGGGMNPQQKPQGAAHQEEVDAVPLGRGQRTRTKSLANLRAGTPPLSPGANNNLDPNAVDASPLVKSLLGPLVTAQDRWLSLEQGKGQLDAHDRSEHQSLGEAIKEMRLALAGKLERGLLALRPSAPNSSPRGTQQALDNSTQLVLWDPQAQSLVLRCCERIVSLYGDLYDGISDVKLLETLLRSFGTPTNTTPGKVHFLPHMLLFQRPADSTLAMPWVVFAGATASSNTLYALLHAGNGAAQFSDSGSATKFVPEPLKLVRAILDATYHNEARPSDVAALQTVSKHHAQVPLTTRLNALLTILGVNQNVSSITTALAKDLKLLPYLSLPQQSLLPKFWMQLLVDVCAMVPLDAQSQTDVVKRGIAENSSLTPTFRLDCIHKLLSTSSWVALDVERDDIRPSAFVASSLPYASVSAPHSIATRAAATGDVDLLRLLLNTGALRHPNKTYSGLSGRTVLTVAVQGGQADAVRVLLEAGKSGGALLDVNAETLEGRALQVAQDLLNRTKSTAAREIVEHLRRAGAR